MDHIPQAFFLCYLAHKNGFTPKPNYLWILDPSPSYLKPGILEKYMMHNTI